MYYITSPSSAGEFALLDISESRTNARAFAKDVGGTVRTEAEFEALVTEHGAPKMTKRLALRIQVTNDTGKVPAANAPVGWDKVEGGPEGTSLEVAPAFAPGEAEAIASAVGKAMPAIVAKIQERKAAKAKAQATPAVSTGKRIYTDESVIKECKAAYAKAFDNIGSKVNHVRWVAGWASATGTRLQRRDAFVVLAETDVADATVNTQWQLVRSGKLDSGK